MKMFFGMGGGKIGGGILLIFFLMFCGKEPGSRKPAAHDLHDPAAKNKIILEIEESFYFNSDFEEYLRLTSGDDIDHLSLVSLSRLADNFFEEKMLLEAARRRGIALSPSEQKEYLAKLSGRIRDQNEDHQPGNVESGYFSQRMLIEKYIYQLVSGEDVGEEEIGAYYEENKRDFWKPARVKVSQILLKTEGKAVEANEQVKGGSENRFREVAREISEGVEADRGGEMGVYELGQLPEELEQVIFSLRKGELSPVVESPYGYHIFRLDERYDPELVPLEQVVDEIRILLLNNKIQERISKHMEELKLEMEWRFYTENLSFPYQRNEDE